EGGIFATVNFTLIDPNKDGKLRPSEFVAVVKINPLCLFEISGDVRARLYLWFQVLGGLISFQQDIIPPITLVSFDLTCEGTTPIIGTLDSDGTLKLNIGPRADQRVFGNTTDGDEEVEIRHESGTADSEDVTVRAFGVTQVFRGVKRIEGDAGSGNDTIDAGGVLVPVTFHGGTGNDNLVAGNGASLLEGDDGNDTLTGGNGPTTVRGGAGDDTLFAGNGLNVLTGGPGANL